MCSTLNHRLSSYPFYGSTNSNVTLRSLAASPSSIMYSRVPSAFVRHTSICRLNGNRLVAHTKFSSILQSCSQWNFRYFPFLRNLIKNVTKCQTFSHIFPLPTVWCTMYICQPEPHFFLLQRKEHTVPSYLYVCLWSNTIYLLSRDYMKEKIEKMAIGINALKSRFRKRVSNDDGTIILWSKFLLPSSWQNVNGNFWK